MKIGVMFPASSREIRPADVIDLCHWYRHLGFDRICFVNNGGMDAVKELPFVEVEDDTNPGIQFDLMNRYVRKMQDCDWVLFCDSDEWLWPLSGETVKEHLAKLPPKCGSLCVNWVLFGNKSQSRSAPCPESCVDRPSLNYPRNVHVKCFVRPMSVRVFDNPHYAHLYPGHSKMDVDGLFSQPNHPAHNDFKFRGFVLAHFYARSVEEAVAKEKSRTLDGTPYRRPGEVSVDFMNDCTEVDTSFRDYWRGVTGNVKP